MSKLQKSIQTKLEKLSQLIDQIDEAHAINSNDPETWDNDTLYNLVENLIPISWKKNKPGGENQSGRLSQVNSPQQKD